MHLAAGAGDGPVEVEDKYYYHQDNLGSTVMMTDESGQVVFEQDYTPFGQTLNLYSYVLQNPLKYVDPDGYMANFAGDVSNRSHLNYGFGYSYDFTNEITDEVVKYLGNAAKMMILGDFTAQEDINALGIAGQIGLDIIGIDAAADIRDLVPV